MSALGRALVLAPARTLTHPDSLATSLNSSSLPTNRPRGFDQRHHRIERAAAGLIGRPSAKIPERPSATIAGGVAEANHER